MPRRPGIPAGHQRRLASGSGAVFSEDGANLGLLVPAVPAERAEALKLARLSPPGHSFRVHTEHLCHFGWSEQFLNVYDLLGHYGSFRFTGRWDITLPVSSYLRNPIRQLAEDRLQGCVSP